MSFTKRLLVFNDVVALLLTALAVVMAYRGQLVNDIVTLALAWIAEAATFHGFYAWKEKNANRSKYAQQWVERMGDKYGWEAAARIAEIVLKD